MIATKSLRDRVRGYYRAIATGDAIAGATETFSPEQILDHYGAPVDGIVSVMPPTTPRARLSPNVKGGGRITDDTLLTLVLAEIYQEKRRHLDAFDMAESFVSKIADEVRWIPERSASQPLVDRLHYPEKWLVARLRFGGVDPREAGVGNVVNCGAAMYIGPVGIVNAGEPEAAYAEAIDLSSAHQSSYGREAAGVLAAAIASAFAPDASPRSVVSAALAHAHDGTKAAIEAVAAAVTKRHGDAPRVIRMAVSGFDSVGDDYLNPLPDARKPSRVCSIEELPVALGIVLATDGDARDAILMAANYGRDSDSVAVMAGGICGGLGGANSVPQDWINEVEHASRLDLDRLADSLTDAALDIMRDDLARATARAGRLANHLTPGQKAHHITP